MLQARVRPPTPFPFIIFTFGLAFESIKELGGASINNGASKKARNLTLNVS